MEDLLQLQLLARQQRTPYAVATIVEATGSTPRTEGKMLVYADGRSLPQLCSDQPYATFAFRQTESALHFHALALIPIRIFC